LRQAHTTKQRDEPMLKNASLPHGLRTQAKWRHTSVCARFSTTRGEQYARAIFTHTWTSASLTVSHTSLAIRVTTRVRRESWGCQCFLGVKDLKEKNMFDPSDKFSIYYTIYLFWIYSKSTFVIINNLQEIII